MSLTSLALFPSWRDYWGMWNPYVEPWLAPLQSNPCYAFRIVVIPSVEAMTIPASGKIEYNFHLVPGSIIYAIFPNFGVFNLTEIATGHELLQEPDDGFKMQTQGADTGSYPSYLLLPSPWPVVGDGLFALEAWGTPGDNFYTILLVAEVVTWKQKR